MTGITAALIQELRKRTGSGMMECKQALVKTQGNIEIAIDHMRKSGQAKAAKKAGRITTEGVILIHIKQDGKYGVIIELNCETDFVAKDGCFKAFGNEVLNTALHACITDVEALKLQCEAKRTALVAKLGENINIRRLGVLAAAGNGNVLSSYLHGVRIGVMVSATGADEELLKHLAMHIAASKPEYINGDDVPVDVVTREHQIQFDIAMQSGKPREVNEKIIAGRMRKFIGEIALTGQSFIMDPSKTVGQVLDEHCATVNNFVRFEVGEGMIDKVENKFHSLSDHHG